MFPFRLREQKLLHFLPYQFHFHYRYHYLQSLHYPSCHYLVPFRFQDYLPDELPRTDLPNEIAPTLPDE